MFKDKLLKYYQNLTEQQLERLKVYYNILIEHSNQYNLTAITEEDEVIIKHFYDSLKFNEALGIEGKKNLSIIDMGTGAGFPGLVIAIMNEDSKFTLVDSIGKKVNFIRTVVETLELDNVTPLHIRSEALGQDKNYRESFDIGIARSVAYLPVLSEYLLPLIKVGGKMVVTKEQPYTDELKDSTKALKILGGELTDTKTYDLPVYENSRAFLTFKKVSQTPGKYPRREGIPTKKPL